MLSEDLLQVAQILDKVHLEKVKTHLETSQSVQTLYSFVTASCEDHETWTSGYKYTPVYT